MEKNGSLQSEHTCGEGMTIQFFTDTAGEPTPEALAGPRLGRPLRILATLPTREQPNGEIQPILHWNDDVGVAVTRAIESVVEGPTADAVKRAVAAAIEEAMRRQQSRS